MAWSQSPVVVAKVIESDQPESETFIGTAQPKRRSTIGCAVDGRMFEFYVDEGDVIDMLAADEDGIVRGKPIAQLRTKTIQIQIDAARAELVLRDNELRQLEASLPEQLVQARARMKSAEATKNRTAAEHKRVEALFKKKSVSQSDLDEAESAAISSEQDHLFAQSVVNEFEATRELKLAQSRAKQLAQQKEVERLEDLKSKYSIRTPFRGHVVKKFAEVGQWIQQGDPIAEVIELDPIEIEIPVPAERIAAIQMSLNEHSKAGKSLMVELQFEALPGKSFTGELANIVPDANRRTRAIPVKIEVANSREDGYPIKPGMLARASLLSGKTEKQLFVPKDALVLGGKSPMLFVIVTDKKDKKKKSVRPVTVQIGASIGSTIAVRGAIKAGDQVVVEGNERLRPGQSIRILKEVPPKPK